MIASEDDSRHPTDGYPTGGLESLGSLIDEEGAEFLAFEEAVGRTYEGTGDDTGLTEELGIDADLQFGGTFFEAFEFLVVIIATPFAVGTEIADGLSDAPEKSVVGVGLEASFVGEGEHLIVDAGGVADAEYVDASVDEFFRDPVDGHIALGTDQYLVLAAECLVDGLDEGGGLAGTWWAVDNGDILSAEDLVDSIFLSAVQVGEVQGVEGEGLGLHGGGIEEVAEVAQTTFGTDDAVESLEHRAVGGLIEEELDAEIFGGLEVDEGGIVGEGDDHAVAVDEGYGGGEGEVGNPRISRVTRVSRITRRTRFASEKADGPTEFEVMFYFVVVRLAEDLDDELVEGVVVTLACFQGEPGIAAFDLPLQTHLLGLFAVGFLLGSVFHLEEKALLLECQYWR